VSQYVVHCKRSPYDVYIGRPGIWGNPYEIGRDGTREQVITAYETYLRQSSELMTRLPELRGRVLGCWCAPQACHGDVLSRLANARRRILVTGSQGWLPEHGQVRRVLTALCALAPNAVLVSGGCPRGADHLCERAWQEFGRQVERVRPDWHPGGSFDRGAGFTRSEAMADRGADICVAFILRCLKPSCAGLPADRGLPYHGTHGSVHCADYAEDHGIPVRRFTPIPLV
jgi:hypothetical protein